MSGRYDQSMIVSGTTMIHVIRRSATRIAELTDKTFNHKGHEGAQGISETSLWTFVTFVVKFFTRPWLPSTRLAGFRLASARSGILRCWLRSPVTATN